MTHNLRELTLGMPMTRKFGLSGLTQANKIAVSLHINLYPAIYESVEQDQPAYMCSLILVCTLCCTIIISINKTHQMPINPFPDNKILDWSK